VRTHVALLRGVNVGGRNRLPMADLREAVASLGHRDVATYVQSGNVVLTSDEPDPLALATALAAAVERRCGVRADVVVLTRAELARVVAGNPFPDEDDPKHLHVVFQQDGAGPGAADAVAAAVEAARAKGSQDDAVVAHGTVYLRTPGGLGRSELAAQLSLRPSERALGGPGTMRNWATTTRLLAMLED
jgi:uncharacterized protein (DUF1697 family)